MTGGSWAGLTRRAPREEHEHRIVELYTWTEQDIVSHLHLRAKEGPCHQRWGQKGGVAFGKGCLGTELGVVLFDRQPKK